jgi:hypothetical protein
MNQLIKLEVTPAQIMGQQTAKIRLEVKEQAKSFLGENEFPLRVVIKNTYGDEKVRWESELPVNHFMEYYHFENKTLNVYTATGRSIVEHKWNPDVYGTTAQHMLDLWLKSNDKSKGVAIGTNDGQTGEWVDAFWKNKIGNMLLVEASEDAYIRLVNNYRQDEWEMSKKAKCVNAVITPKHNERLVFWETEQSNGEINSVDKTHLHLHGANNVKQVDKISVGINELLIDNDFADLDWLHIDVEGLDDKLIRALDFNRISKPKLIIYEKLHVKEEARLELWFYSNGYELYKDEFGGYSNVAKLK